jgi:hypothetical protein
VIIFVRARAPLFFLDIPFDDLHANVGSNETLHAMVPLPELEIFEHRAK